MVNVYIKKEPDDRSHRACPYKRSGGEPSVYRNTKITDETIQINYFLQKILITIKKIFF